MDRVVFADGWQQFFAKYGLEYFDDFYNYTGGTVIGKNTKEERPKADIRGRGRAQSVLYEAVPQAALQGYCHGPVELRPTYFSSRLRVEKRSHIIRKRYRHIQAGLSWRTHSVRYREDVLSDN